MLAGWERERVERAAFWGLAGLALAVWAWHAVPLLLGERTLYFRDVLHNHFSLKWVGAQALRQGEIPVFVEQLGNGLPFRGNPSALPFYPGNLLYVLLPFWSAFGGHFALHWLLAALTMYWLGRTLGLGRTAALLAAVTYAGGGWYISALSFYNVATVAAWWPAVIAAALRGGAGGIALGGAACGMALLGGEPLTAFLGMVPVATLATGRHGLRRGLGIAAAIGAIGALAALPQIAATAEVLPYSFRGFRAAEPGEAEIYFFKWPRLFELLIPFPFGHPGFIGPRGWWLLDRLPFYFCLNAGLVGAWLATRALRLKQARPWLLIGMLGVLTAWVGGVDAALVRQLSGGLFRYTEKFLFWYALALPVLAGFGLEEILRRRRQSAAQVATPPVRRRYLGTLTLALVFAVGAVVALRAVPALLGFLVTDPARASGLERALLSQALTLSLQMGASALLLLLLVHAVHRGRTAMIVAMQIVALAPISTLLMSDSTAYYDNLVTWTRDLEPGTGFVDTTATMPPWGVAIYRLEGPQRYRIERVDGEATSSATGLLNGLRYPMQLDSEGLGQATYTFLIGNMFLRPWHERARWLAILGVEAFVSIDRVDTPEVEFVAERRFAGAMLYRLKIRNPLPFAFWPDEVLPEPSPAEMMRRVSKLSDARKTVLAERAVPAHRPGGTVMVREWHNDRVVVHVDGEGGLLVVRRLFHPLWQARSGELRLPTSAANLVLLGVEVPAGSHDVVLEPARGLVPWGGAVATLTALICGAVGWRNRRPLFAAPLPAPAPFPEDAREPA